MTSLEIRIYGPGGSLLEIDKFELPPKPVQPWGPCVQVKDFPAGRVHRQDCFIVTTRWNNLPWVPHPGPPNCYYCLEI